MLQLLPDPPFGLLAFGDVADGDDRHQGLAVHIADEGAAVTEDPLLVGLDAPDEYLHITEIFAAQDAGQRPFVNR